MRAKFILLSCTVTFVAAQGVVTQRLQAQATIKPEKYALLIAVARYKNAAMNQPQLKYPEKDAAALKDRFAASGYEVDVLLGADATRKAVLEKLDNLRHKGNAEGVVVVGLFGHGVEMEDIDYFCPYDTELREQSDQGHAVFDRRGLPVVEEDPSSMVPLSAVLRGFRLSAAGGRALLADCCRKAPNAARGRAAGFGRKFNIDEVPENTSVLFACKPGQQAFEDPAWEHGAFTKCILDEMPRLAVDGQVSTAVLVDRLKRRVPELVMNVTHGESTQTPALFSTDTIDLQMIDRPMRQDPEFWRKRREIAKEMLYRAGKTFAEDKSLTDEAKEKLALLFAWDYAYLGNAARTMQYCDIWEGYVKDSTKGAKGANVQGRAQYLAIKSRMLGLLGKHLPAPDAENAFTLLGMTDEEKADKQIVALVQKGRRQAELFSPDGTLAERTSELDALLSNSNQMGYAALGNIVADRNMLTGQFARDELPSRLDKVVVEYDTDKLLIAAIRGDSPKVETLLADRKPMDHRPYWVVPFAVRHEVATLERLLKFETTQYELAAHFLAAETLLNEELDADAKSVLASCAAVAGLKEPHLRGISLYVGFRDFPLLLEGDGLSSTGVFEKIALAHTCGRLNEPELCRKLLGDGEEPMQNLLFVDGLLHGMPKN